MRNPLLWPTGKPRKEKRHKAPFSATQKTTILDLERAIKQLELTEVEITIDHRVRLDGGLSDASNANSTGDPGVAVYFKRKGQDVVIAVDSFTTVWGNLRAVGLYLHYLARLEAYGMNIADQAFVGFKALPAGKSNLWWEVLGVTEDADPDTIRAAYRKLAVFNHPDNGGNSDEFQRIVTAYRVAKKVRDL